MRISRRERAAGEIIWISWFYHFLHAGLLICQKNWRNAKEKLTVLR
jgi:hypothetical protein